MYKISNFCFIKIPSKRSSNTQLCLLQIYETDVKSKSKPYSLWQGILLISTVNIYRYKAIGANATSSVISTIGDKGLPIGAKGFPDMG